MNSVAAMKENELKQVKLSLSKLNEESTKATAEKTKILGELLEAQKKIFRRASRVRQVEETTCNFNFNYPNYFTRRI